MESTSAANKRIAKNTMMLYFRQILILLVSLYTVRVILNTLGVEDYGIYNVVAGTVTFFSFLSGTLASATQRFFSFALGKGDDKSLKTTFSVNLIVYFGIAIVALILLETIGLWFIKNKLTLPSERFDVAIILYHTSVLTFIINIIRTPFNAIIIAHEDMNIFAYVSILEALMKLGVVYLLLFIDIDKLQLYGYLLLGVAIIDAILYIGISSYRYPECQYRKLYWDKNILKEITGFTGWTLFGQLTTVFRNQAVTILLNQFFFPVIVAAQSIARSITGYITVFANNFNTSLYPPIIKYYASNEKDKMFSLIYNGSKIAFFLLWVFALPLMLEMETVLKFWLKSPPIEAVLFTQLALVETIIHSVSMPITTAARAPGRMKKYELSLGTIQIGIFVASWIVLKFGAPAYSVFIIAIIANLLMFFVRLYITRGLINIPIKAFALKVIYPVMTIIILSTIPSFVIHYILPKGVFYSIIIGISSVLISSVLMYYIGLDKVWRIKIRTIVLNKIKR